MTIPRIVFDPNLPPLTREETFRMAADGLRTGLFSYDQVMDMIGFVPTRQTDDERAYRGLLAPAIASPPDALARLALADWLEERGGDGSGWRWLAETEREPVRGVNQGGAGGFVFSFCPPSYETQAGLQPRCIVPRVILQAMRAICRKYDQADLPPPVLPLSAAAVRNFCSLGICDGSAEVVLSQAAAAWVALGPELQAEARRDPLPR